MTDKESKLTIEELKDQLMYEPETGLFWWVVPKQGRSLEHPAGGETHQGYRTVTINDEKYLYHRLAWFYMTGEWPPEYVDHIDGNPRNNRYDNLRLATAQQNAQNKKRKYNSYTGIKGVFKDYMSDTWFVRVRLGDKVMEEGPFYNYKQACKVYDNIASKAFGEFARSDPPRVQRATFKNEEVTQAVEDFIKDKVLVGGRYIKQE